MPSLETQFWSPFRWLSTELPFAEWPAGGGREQGTNHGGQEAPGQKGVPLSQAAGMGCPGQLTPGGRQDGAASSESAFTLPLPHFTEEDPMA